MTPMLALHTWTLDSTSLPDLLRITRAVGWDGVELRRVDFARAAEKGQPAAEVLRLVKASGLRVASRPRNARPSGRTTVRLNPSPKPLSRPGRPRRARNRSPSMR